MEEYERRFALLPRATLLQSPAYGRWKSQKPGHRARYGRILIGGQEAGLVQVVEARAFLGLLHAVILDRGPLWMPGFGGAAHSKAFFDAFQAAFRPRPGRRRRILPECEDGTAIRALLSQCGLTLREGQAGYRTLEIDISQPEESLHANLKKNWRGALKQGQAAGLTLEWDADGAHLDWFLKRYHLDKVRKGYNGPAPEDLRGLSPGSAIIGRAVKGDKPVAAIMILIHGAGATYQAGWNGTEGREMCAHHLLLWSVIPVLKERGVKVFDLGGIDEKQAKGVSQFKDGMGGRMVQLVGHYG